MYLVWIKDLLVRVDAKYIKGMLKNPDIQPNATINHWIAAILLFNFEIEHTPGITHVPDGLSRRRPAPEDPEEDDDVDEWIDRACGFMIQVMNWQRERRSSLLEMIPASQLQSRGQNLDHVFTGRWTCSHEKPRNQPPVMHWGQTPWAWVHGRGPTLAMTLATALVSHVSGTKSFKSWHVSISALFGIGNPRLVWPFPTSFNFRWPMSCRHHTSVASGPLSSWSWQGTVFFKPSCRATCHSIPLFDAATLPPKCYSVARCHMCDLSHLASVDTSSLVRLLASMMHHPAVLSLVYLLWLQFWSIIEGVQSRASKERAAEQQRCRSHS
jgi:hypothetical protein